MHRGREAATPDRGCQAQRSTESHDLSGHEGGRTTLLDREGFLKAVWP